MIETDDINLPDPTRPDATAAERAEALIGRILLDDNPVRRYATIRALQDGALREAAAITLLQLREERGTTEAAAAAVGISRQAMTELLDKADAPGAREQRDRRDTYARRYGRYLAAIQTVIQRQPPNRADQADIAWSRLEPLAVTSTAVLRRLETTAAHWLRTITERTERDRLRAELDAAATGLAGWDAITTPRHLTLAERSDAYIGLHTARARRKAS